MAPSSRSSRILIASTLGFVCFSVLRLQGFFFPEQLTQHHRTASQRHHHQQCRDRENLMKLLKENSNPEKCRLPLHLHKKKVKHVYGMTTCLLSVNFQNGNLCSGRMVNHLVLSYLRIILRNLLKRFVYTDYPVQPT